MTYGRGAKLAYEEYMQGNTPTWDDLASERKQAFIHVYMVGVGEGMKACGNKGQQ